MPLNRSPLKTISPLLVGVVFSLMLTNIMITPTSAQSRRYSPPSGGTPSTASGVGAARGETCTDDSIGVFTALAPYNHVGQTSATHPTFAWYVPEQKSFAIEFRLYVYGADNKLQFQPVYKTLLNSTPGVMTFTLPQSEPPLQSGQRYFWRAALLCDPNHASEDQIIDVEMQIVDHSLPESERWYDLLKAAIETTPRFISALLLELAALEQASGEALAESISASPQSDRSSIEERSEDLLHHSQSLTQIANMGR